MDVTCQLSFVLVCLESISTISTFLLYQSYYVITVEKGCNFRMFSDRKALQQARCLLNGVVRVWISRAMVQIRISFVLLQMETLQIGGAVYTVLYY